MLVSLRWLKDYIDIPWSISALVERLTMSGAKVEAVHQMGAELKGVRVGKIVEVDPHPSSEELWVCQVDLGDRRVQSVCGAPNTGVGMLVPVAPEGVTLAGLSATVEATEVRGVLSEAVLCSEAELGLSNDHSGLMRLPDDVPIGAELGVALGLDDSVIEFEIYPNRADQLSVYGIAREVAAITGGEVKSLPGAPEEKGGAASKRASVAVEAPDLCPRYIARVIEGVRIAPSPAWMQARLRLAGMRPINNVVDVTNYVMLELGQPLHAFDLERLEGSKIIVRTAVAGEQMETLDGVLRTFAEDDLLICDEKGPVAIAGIMGGERTEVRETTTSILLESATFDAANVRKTSRRLGLRTEASHRFEKGLHPHLAQVAIDRAAALLAELGGGEVRVGRIDVAEPIEEETKLSVRPNAVNRALGTDLSPAEMKRILKALDFGVELDEGGSVLRLQVPWYRSDVRQECDVIEEVARIHGFDQIEATLPRGASVQGGLAWPLSAVEQVRDRLVAAGLSESVTYSFISPRLYDRLGLEADHPLRQSIALKNPLSEEQSVMRTTILGSLLDALSLNQRRQVDDVRLFELGKVYIPTTLPLESLPSEKWTLAIALSGEAPTEVWGRGGRQVDFYDLKGCVEAVADVLGLSLDVRPVRHSSLHPGRSAELVIGDTVAGVMGEVHPKVAEAFEIRDRAYVAEIDLEVLFKQPQKATRYRPVPRHPAVDRDVALLVPRDVAVARVESLIASEGGAMLRGWNLFDVYEGKQIPEGMRSVAYTLTFQADDRTLTDEEIAEVYERITRRLEEELGVTVRR